MTKREEFAKVRRELLKRLGRKTLICARCGHKSESVHLHHIKEMWEGGSDEPENLIPLCNECHVEWDTYGGAELTFGEFLTTLSYAAFALMYRAGYFRLPKDYPLDAKMFYLVQFVGKAEKHGTSYFIEMGEENKMFCAYPYSNAIKMLELYGKHYEPFTPDEVERYGEYVNGLLKGAV